MKQISPSSRTVLLITIILAACRFSPPVPVATGTATQVQSPATKATSTELQNSTSNLSITNTADAMKIKAEVWADNWFAFYLSDQLMMEDSVSINTERSFNAEVFTFEAAYPMSLNFIVKDFKENDTGLEYIGTNKQQMGDGGLIAQFTNADTGELIAVTNSNWVCLVIHEAPLDKSCEKTANPIAGSTPCGFTSLKEPVGWKDANFDDSSWSNATVYTEAQVSPKDGYNQISWNSSTQFIWGPDLETNNTLLCRLTLAGPNP